MNDWPTIFIQNHQGLGDMLVANAIFRHFAKTHNVIMPCKFHNVPSVQFMLRDSHVALLGVHNDEGAKRLAAAAEKHGEVLRLGMFGKGFDEQHWDREFYRLAGVPFEKRWSEWKIERDLSREFEPPKEPYAFIHDDRKRDFGIQWKHITEGLQMVCTLPGKTDNIFNYCRLIEEAEELHMIDSCFAILADSLPSLKCKQFVIHQYARPTGLMPTYRFPVEILR